MGARSSKQVCECCTSFIQSQRTDSKLCKLCRAYMQRRYGVWRTNEKREIKKYEEKIKELESLLKRFESIEKEIQPAFEGALEKDRKKKEIAREAERKSEEFRKMFSWTATK